MVTYDFAGRVALVTGGGSGIGLATAQAFAEAGAQVAVVDINGEAAQRATESLRASGHRAEAFELDVADEAAVARTIRGIDQHFGRVDFAINNAGVESDPVPMADLANEKWQRVCDVNLSSIFHCMKAEIPLMLRNGRGAIVNTASVAGLIGGYNMSAYIATKHGVIGLTKAAATDYAARGIRINAICPGFIATPFTADAPQAIIDRLLFSIPAGRPGKPEEIAKSMLWLCSEDASYINGHALVVDGAASLGTAGTRFDDLF